jgi:NAD(P)-dependent dehydrogenase (short-subunit alcohol dehydrogenase family)
MQTQWTADQISDQEGRTAVVTGANSGLGLITARELARAGAHVTLACRNTDKGQSALKEVRAEVPGARVELAALDLASLASIESFTDQFLATHAALDLLINNAGVMASPRRQTKDGFELQLGTNHLGHFALTGRLMGTMAGQKDARIVTVSSNAHKRGRIDFGDLQHERSYNRWVAYAQAKLANLMFALELDRRLRAAGSEAISVAAHPGYAATNLQSAAAPWLDRAVMVFANRVIAQSAEHGALPTLYAATYPGLAGGTYVGPDGLGEFRGYPTLVSPSAAARDEAAARRLWEVSEKLTGVRFDLADTAAGQLPAGP